MVATAAVPVSPSAPLPPRRRPAVLGAVVVVVVGGGIIAGVTVAGRPHQVLPKHLATTDQALPGRVGAPGFQEEGQPVRVTLAHGAVTAVVTGPHVPAQAAAVAIPNSITTFDVALTAATTDVPLSLSQFVVLDQSAHYVRPIADPGTSAPPAVLHPGQSAHFQLRAYLPTGEGIIAWSPDGSHVEGKWDFIVEND